MSLIEFSENPRLNPLDVVERMASGHDWAFARADYRYERRESNIDLFDTDAHSMTVQVGVRLYRPRERR